MLPRRPAHYRLPTAIVSARSGQTPSSPADRRRAQISNAIRCRGTVSLRGVPSWIYVAVHVIIGGVTRSVRDTRTKHNGTQTRPSRAPVFPANDVSRQWTTMERWSEQPSHCILTTVRVSKVIIRI